MNEELFTGSIWFSLVLAVALAVIDAALSLAERYYYHSGAKYRIKVEDEYPLDKPYHAARGVRQFFNRRYVLFVLGTALGVPAAWWIFTRANPRPDVFVAAMGGLLLLETAECVRLARVVTLYRLALRGEGFDGQVSVPRWLPINLMVVDLYGFALLYLLIYLLTGSLFFLGGAGSCFVRAHAARDGSIYIKWMKKHGRTPWR